MTGIEYGYLYYFKSNIRLWNCKNCFVHGFNTLFFTLLFGYTHTRWNDRKGTGQYHVIKNIIKKVNLLGSRKELYNFKRFSLEVNSCILTFSYKPLHSPSNNLKFSARFRKNIIKMYKTAYDHFLCFCKLFRQLS